MLGVRPGNTPPSSERSSQRPRNDAIVFPEFARAAPAVTDLEHFVEAPEFLVGPTPKGRLVVLGAPGASGKSLLALEILAVLTVGGTAFCEPHRPERSSCALYYDFENRPSEMAERVKQMGERASR